MTQTVKAKHTHVRNTEPCFCDQQPARLPDETAEEYAGRIKQHITDECPECLSGGHDRRHDHVRREKLRGDAAMEIAIENGRALEKALTERAALLEALRRLVAVVDGLDPESGPTELWDGIEQIEQARAAIRLATQGDEG